MRGARRLSCGTLCLCAISGGSALWSLLLHTRASQRFGAFAGPGLHAAGGEGLRRGSSSAFARRAPRPRSLARVPEFDAVSASFGPPSSPLWRRATAAASVSPASGPGVAEEGSIVTIHFDLKHAETGEVLDSTAGREPLRFACGGRDVLAGVDGAVRGMAAGEEKELAIDASAGFGEVDPEKMVEFPRKSLPEDIDLGAQLSAQGPSGPLRAVVKSLGTETATLDFNHPLAGVPLLISVTVLEVSPPPEIEVETVSPGDGASFPKAGDRLAVHYTGRLAADGVVFDSSRERGEPFEFTIGVEQVIRGWDVGMMRMSLGESATLRIPSSMGYGGQGAGNVIPPGADLIFDVELLRIN